LLRDATYVKTPHLVLLGTNHNYAPIDFREKLFVKSQDLPNRLKSLVKNGRAIQEAVILCTCNRAEVYAVASQDADVRGYLTDAMTSWSTDPIGNLEEHSYLLYDRDALRHLITVTMGLDSLVKGEEQIQGQVREAARVAKQNLTAGHFLDGLFQYAIRASSRIRQECGFEFRGASVSSAAVSILRNVSTARPIHSILLIGAGKMMTLAASDLSTSTPSQVWVANRTIQRAEELANRFGGKPIAFNKIPEVLLETEAVLSCTSSTNFIITKDVLEDIMQKRDGNPLVLIDASVPRNIDPEVSGLPNVQLFNIDDLAPFVKIASESLRTQLEKADAMILEEADRFFARLRSNDARDTLKGLRTMAEDIRRRELSRALSKIGHVSDREKEILELLTTRIINKLLYEPTARLKEHMGNGNGEAYEAMVRELFGIDQEND